MNINGSELLLILLVAVMVLGPKELPKLGRTVGTAVREFRKATHSVSDELGLADILKEDPAQGKN